VNLSYRCWSRLKHLSDVAGVLVLILVSATWIGASVLEEQFFEQAVPAAPGSLAPVLSQGPGGELVLSWLEPVGDAHALKYSVWRDGQWMRAATVMQSESLFVNWADVPSVVPTGRDTLLAQWLRKTAAGTYDYGVRLARSTDGGRTWSAPVTPHRDGLHGEHGFVSLVPWPAGGTAALWLDGRGMTAHGEDPTQSMTLRHAVLEPSGEAGTETMLDARTCECCPTGAARAGDAVVVVYRDRSEREVRDIYSVRWKDGQWSDPQRVAADRWVMPGCPVNGPAIAAAGNDVVVAWFTAPGESARVNVAWSRDGGRSFLPPMRVDQGAPTGRADVALLADGTAAVCWIESIAKEAEVRMRRVSAKGARGQAITIARTSSARRAGFPRVVSQGDRLVCAWTDPADSTRIRSAQAAARALPR
jgi:hypothetical protein